MQNGPERFSIVVPTHNDVNYLCGNIESIKGLDYDTSTLEVIVVDDGSTDDTELRLKQVTPGIDIRYVRTENLGASHARNVGINESSNSIIVFVDADVTLKRDILNRYFLDFQRDDVDIVQGNIWEQMVQTRLTKMHSLWRKSVFLDRVQSKDGLLNTLNTRNVAVRRSLIKNFMSLGHYLFNESMSSPPFLVHIL